MPKQKSKTVRALPPVMYIYCEGKNTERIYLQGYLDQFHKGDRDKKLVPTNKNTPVQLVEVAIAHKNSTSCPKGDSFWVVYDRESTAKYPDQLHLNAHELAKKAGINIALSNVCFEIWLLLHLVENTAPFTSCDDLLAKSPFKKELKKLGVQQYDKSLVDLFNLIGKNVETARQRAKKMNKATVDSAAKGVTLPHQLNPYTDVHLLLDAIDEFK